MGHNLTASQMLIPESFQMKETRCRLYFESLGPVYNTCTPEKHDIVFSCGEDYKAAIGILGISAKLYPMAKIITFEMMSNHIHMVISGSAEDIQSMFGLFRKRLGKYLDRAGHHVDLTGFTLKLIPINDLEYLRNAIAYINRNGFVVMNDVTPFTYPWGANRFFFHPEIKHFSQSCRHTLTVSQLRILFSGKSGDKAKGLFVVGDYVSPLSFCHVDIGENVFRDAKHYFYCVAKKVEAYSEIAKSLGEELFYTDDDLFNVARNISSKSFNISRPSMLGADQKIGLAKRLHYEYNASLKQIGRILKMQESLLSSFLG